MDPNKSPERPPIGAKPKRKNQQAQARASAESKKKVEAGPSQPTNEKTFREMLGILETLIKDWSSEDGLVLGDVMDQLNKDICWAICLVRIVQAFNNIGVPIDQQEEYSISELIEQITKFKPNESEYFGLANLKIAFRHIAKTDHEGASVIKETSNGKFRIANAVGKRVKAEFHLYEDVDASFIRARLDSSPVALLIESSEPEFVDLGQEGVYNLPKKTPISSKSTPLHSLLLIAYGTTKEGKDYIIGQNSYGEGWGCKGYVQIFIEEKCDIFCLK